MDSKFAFWSICIIHLTILKCAFCQVTIINTSPGIEQLSSTNLEIYCNVTSNFNPTSHTHVWKKDTVNLFVNGVRTAAADSRMTYSRTDTGGSVIFKLGVNDTVCDDRGVYTCEIQRVLPAQHPDIPVNISVFDVRNVGCNNINKGIQCFANETNPKAKLELRSSSGKFAESDDGSDDMPCGTSLSTNVSLTEDSPGTHSANLSVYLKGAEVYKTTVKFQIGSDTTTVSVKVPVPSGPGCGLICIILIILAVVVSLIISGVTGYFLWKKKCPCQQSSGNVPYEFEIDGVKEDKTIEISPSMPIRLAATCYGAKPPASIQWCISYNGKDPVDMTEKDYGNSDALNTSVTTNKRDPKTSDTHSKLEMVPNEDHDGAVIHCVAITKISADEEKWDLKTSPKITLKLKKGQVGDYPGQGGYYQGQGGDYRHQGGDYRGQDGYHQGQGGDNHGQGGNYHRHVGQAGQEYQPHGNTRNDKDPFPQPGKRPNALEPIQGQRTLTPIGDIEKTSFKKKRQTNKQTSEL